MPKLFLVIKKQHANLARLEQERKQMAHFNEQRRFQGPDYFLVIPQIERRFLSDDSTVAAGTECCVSHACLDAVIVMLTHVRHVPFSFMIQ
jgi:hypothetical protein